MQQQRMMSCNRRTAGSKSAQRQLPQLPRRPPLAKSNSSSRCLAMLSPSSPGQAWGDGVGKGTSSSAPRAHSTECRSFGVASVGEGLDFRSLPWPHRSGSLPVWARHFCTYVRYKYSTVVCRLHTTHNKATTWWTRKYGACRYALHSTVPHVSGNGAALSLPVCLFSLPARPDALWSRSKYQTEPHRWRQVP